MSVSVHGSIDKALIERVIRNASRKGIHAALDVVASASQAQVPLDKGPLQASCAVDVSDDGKEGTISYDTPYAVRQHEETGYNHQRGRKAKYLEGPVNDSSVTAQAMAAFAAEAGGEFG